MPEFIKQTYMNLLPSLNLTGAMQYGSKVNAIIVCSIVIFRWSCQEKKKKKKTNTHSAADVLGFSGSTPLPPSFCLALCISTCSTRSRALRGVRHLNGVWLVIFAERRRGGKWAAYARRQKKCDRHVYKLAQSLWLTAPFRKICKCSTTQVQIN